MKVKHLNCYYLSFLHFKLLKKKISDYITFINKIHKIRK